jgi:hypothetical protein
LPKKIKEPKWRVLQAGRRGKGNAEILLSFFKENAPPADKTNRSWETSVEGGKVWDLTGAQPAITH